MKTAIERWEAMEPKVRDEWVASNVLGWWQRDDGWWASDGMLEGVVVPRFSNYANPDYWVLRHAREKWEERRKTTFLENLGRILVWRQLKVDTFDVPSIFFMEHYQPGDYSKAAFLTLSERQTETAE